MATKQLPVSQALMSIPAGISWTAPEKSRNWQKPPKLVKITDVIKYYMTAISSEELVSDMLDTLETNIPLSVIAESMMLAGVSEGIHTIDTGILAMPVMMEMLKAVAMLNNIDTKDYASDYDKDEKVSNRVVKQAIAQVFNTLEAPATEAAPTEEVVSPKGLMARKTKGTI
jgi:DNA integrity scanning protein DisA with diadenylate cyclase activity